MFGWLWVGIGGFVGSVLRYLIGLIPLGRQDGFPYKTLCINLLGAFAIGLLTALAARRVTLDPRMTLLLKAGVCGGFTTFSTFALETATLLQNGKILPALLYLLFSVLGGLGAVLLAEWLLRA